MAKANEGEWLTLERASKRLGVHATTLRRWADQGAIDYFLTPGGHRRFSVAAIEQFARDRQRSRLPSTREQAFAERTIARARRDLPMQEWQTVYTEHDREISRCLGRRLLGLILQFVSRSDEGHELLTEAYLIGREHARLGQQMGQPLNNLLKTINFFRMTLIEVAILHLLGTSRAGPEEHARLLRRIERIIGEVQSGVVETYGNGGPSCVDEQLPATR